MRTAKIAATVIVTLGWALSLCALSQDVGRRTYDPVVRKVAQKHGVEPNLIHAIIRAESNYDSFAVSEKGAMGLMQLMPATAKAYGVNNFCDPEENIEGGTKYLKDLIKLYGGKTNFVLAAYNAGQEAVKKYKGIPPIRKRETTSAGSRLHTGSPRSGPGPSSTGSTTGAGIWSSPTIRGYMP